MLNRSWEGSFRTWGSNHIRKCMLPKCVISWGCITGSYFKRLERHQKVLVFKEEKIAPPATTAAFLYAQHQLAFLTQKFLHVCPIVTAHLRASLPLTRHHKPNVEVLSPLKIYYGLQLKVWWNVYRTGMKWWERKTVWFVLQCSFLNLSQPACQSQPVCLPCEKKWNHESPIGDRPTENMEGLLALISSQS